jgi:predicted metal-binding membrane protein
VDRSDVVPRPGLSSIADLDRRQLILFTALFALAAAGWIVTDQRMAGMDAGPGTDPGSLGFYVTVWLVMMGAMMFPSIAGALCRRRRAADGRGLPAHCVERDVLAALPQSVGLRRAPLASRRARRGRYGYRARGRCVGCCWALMASLFALGVMSLGWRS